MPACRGVTTWGLLDSTTWLDFFPPFDAFRPNAPLLFDAQLAPKPAYFAVRDAVARRAVPFFAQATSLREAYDAGVGGGTVRGRRLRLGGRALRRAERFLEGGQFARACRRLRRVANVLAAATGTAARDLEGTVRMLQADLRCDEP